MTLVELCTAYAYSLPEDTGPDSFQPFSEDELNTLETLKRRATE